MHLQPAAVEDSHVADKLTAVVADDEGTDAATARLESALEALVEVGLLADGQVLLDITGLGHGDD